MAVNAPAKKPNALAFHFAHKAGIHAEPSQLSQLSDSVATSLGRMAQLAEAKVAHSTLRDVLGDGEKSPVDDAVKLITTAKGLAEIDDLRTRRMSEELDRERETRRELQEKTQQMTAQTEGASMNMMFNFMKLMEERDRRWEEKLERMEERHQAELREREGNKKPDETTSFLNDMMREALLEKLQGQPGLLDQVKNIKELSSVLFPPAPSNNNQLALTTSQFQYDLGKQQMNIDFEKWRFEQEQREREKEREQARDDKRIGVWQSLARSVENIAPVIVELVTGKNASAPGAGPAMGPAQPAQPPVMYRFRCSNKECGREWKHPKNVPGKCPACQSDLAIIGQERGGQAPA